MNNTIQIKIEKLEKINDGVLYIYYRATNLETKEIRDSSSTAYYGSDIINFSKLSELELNQLPHIGGKRYSKELVLSSETRTYSYDNGDIELTKEGWANDIHKAIEYVMY